MTDEATVVAGVSRPFAVRMMDRQLVACIRFDGVLNVTSRIWMVHDWAKREGRQLVGPPSCIFGLDRHGPQHTPCEVQWSVAEDPEDKKDASFTDDEVLAIDEGFTDAEALAINQVGLKWLRPRKALVTYHQGRNARFYDTVHALRVWGEALGYRMLGDRRKIYHSYTKAPAERWLTEIQLFVDGDGDGIEADGC